MNARDVHGWATAVRELDPTLGNANSAAKRRSVAESTLNAYARGVAGCHPESRPGDRLAYRMPS